MPTFSVVVPVYNVENYLSQCLNTLVNQSFKDFELILVNDGSTDTSGSLCEEWGKKDHRIKVIHKTNEGLGFARNTGIENCTGDYIVFVDSDDYVSYEMLEIYDTYLQRFNADVIYSENFYRVDNKGNIIGPLDQSLDSIFYKNDSIFTELLPDVISSPPEFIGDGKIGVSVWKGVYKRSLFKDKGLLFHSEREFISEDAIFQIDCLKLATSALVIPDILYYYRENFGSLSMKYKEDRFELDKILYNEQLKRVKGLPNQEILEERIERILIANIRLCIFQESLYKSSRIHKRLQTIRQICKDPISKAVLYHYPIHRLPFPKRLICVLAKYNMSMLLLALTLLKYRNRSV